VRFDERYYLGLIGYSKAVVARIPTTDQIIKCVELYLLIVNNRVLSESKSYTIILPAHHFWPMVNGGWSLGEHLRLIYQYTRSTP
jgi:hypothetical protein